MNVTIWAAVGTEPTAAYDIMRFWVLVGAGCLIWLVWSVLRALTTPVAPPGDDSESDGPLDTEPDTPLLDSRAPDPDRYTSLMPVVESIESTEAIAARGADLIPDVEEVDGPGVRTFHVSGYEVSLDPLSCECPWWAHRGGTGTVCKHIVAVAGHVLARVKG